MNFDFCHKNTIICMSLNKKQTKGPCGFEELKKYMRLGNEFCRDLASILVERAESELNYSKGLNKSSLRLQKLSKDFHGTLSDAWLKVALQFDAEAEMHKSLSFALQEEIIKPLKILADNQNKCKKPVGLKIAS
jgi:nostrin